MNQEIRDLIEILRDNVKDLSYADTDDVFIEEIHIIEEAIDLIKRKEKNEQ